MSAVVSNADRLEVTRCARELAVDVYRITESLPDPERFGLTQQIRRAVVSIGSNIVEGADNGSDAIFSRHLGVAIGSTAEVVFQMRLATDLGYVDPIEATELIDRLVRLQRMLRSLRRALRPREPT